MVNLLTVGPFPLLVVTISIAMIALITNRLNELREWQRPIMAFTLVVRPFRRERTLQVNLTYLKIAYFSMFWYGVTHFLGIGYLILSSTWPSLGYICIWILWVNGAFVGAWIFHHAAFAKEQIIRPAPIPV